MPLTSNGGWGEAGYRHVKPANILSQTKISNLKMLFGLYEDLEALVHTNSMDLVTAEIMNQLGKHKQMIKKFILVT